MGQGATTWQQRDLAGARESARERARARESARERARARESTREHARARERHERATGDHGRGREST
eukprot:9679721-Alexandrium_andersonii.AAC.1